MKNAVVLIMGLCIVLLVMACSKDEDTPINALSDYRPMIYVQNSLYGDTGRTTALPDGAVLIGTIQKTVRQNEPMVKENFTSNTFPVGSEVFSNELDTKFIYVKMPDNSPEQYATFEFLE